MALADRVTADLQLGNDDLHLRLLHHEDELIDGEEDPVAEEAASLRRAEFDAGGMARTERLAGNIGLLEIRPILYAPHHAGAAAAAAMSLLAGTDALLIDVRRCRGGSPDMVALLCSCLFDDEPIHLNDLITPGDGSLRQFWTIPHLAGRRFGSIKPIWVLISSTTFSGAEELTYNLQQLGRAVIVGERTRGGAHPREGFVVHPHLEATVPIQRAVNPVSGTNWEGIGVAPDVEVDAEGAFAEAYVRALEHVLALPADSGRLSMAEEAREALMDSAPPWRSAEPVRGPAYGLGNLLDVFGYHEVIDGVRFAFTDRFGGVSQPPYAELNLGSASGDEAGAIAENFRRVASAFEVEPDAVIRISQVHGRDVHVVRAGAQLPASPMPFADAIVTTRTDVVLCVRAADCLPVLLADPANGVAGAVHSGRRGLYAGVVPAAVEAMRELGAESITAVLGPYACGKCYEVPEEMRHEVAGRSPAAYAETSWGTPSLDVAAGVTAQLAELDCRVVDATSCTIESEDLYSYRREGQVSGRLAGLVRLAA